MRELANTSSPHFKSYRCCGKCKYIACKKISRETTIKAFLKRRNYIALLLPTAATCGKFSLKQLRSIYREI